MASAVRLLRWLIFACFACQSLQAGKAEVMESSASGSSAEGSALGPVFEPPVTTYGNLTCEPYYAGGWCQPVLGHFPFVVTNNSRSDQFEAAYVVGLVISTLYLLQPSPLCIRAAIPLLCRYSFPTCDPSYIMPTYQPICRWDCLVMRDFLCEEPWRKMQEVAPNINLVVLDDFDCEPLRHANAGDAPMCISTILEGEVPLPLRTGDTCYTGRGRGYNGTASHTESGLECQVWIQSYPHQHLLHYQNYPEIQGGHNFCRNPGERGERPWCFTTDRSVRWEYCDVPVCASGPTCQIYSGSLCYSYGSIGMDQIFTNTSVATQGEYEEALTTFLLTIETFSPRCQALFLEFMCVTTFPICDMSHVEPRPHKVCRSYCEKVHEVCDDDLNNLFSFNVLLRIDPLVIPDCSTLPEASGGDAPECYTLITSPNTTADLGRCYDPADKGFTYNGTLNTTTSGKPCMPWDSSTPHSHPLTSISRGYLAQHNHCRNPEKRGEKPWCYTTDPDTRWEYCDVPQCSEAEEDSSVKEKIILYAPIGGGALLALALALLFCLCGICCCKKKNKSQSINMGVDVDSVRYISVSQNVEMVAMQKGIEFNKGDLNPLYSPNPLALQNKFQYDGIRLPELLRENIMYIRDLGQGRFGLVVQGEVRGSSSGEPNTVVAIKVLKEGVSPEVRKEFFHEASLMNAFDHPNIVRLLGVCIEQDPLCMVFEFMELGDLNNFLRQAAPGKWQSGTQPSGQPPAGPGLTTQQLVGMAVDIASGLHYLSLNHYVHRDLATRNCLINSSYRVKISDFGLSQDVYTRDYFRLGDSELLPIRWMPPEAILYAKFTPQSDIWSFGVVLWEIFTFGMQPYFSLTNEEVVQHVRGGNVMSCPDNCPEEIYDLMIDCWAMNPEQRPTAGELHTALQRWNPELSASLQMASAGTAVQPKYQNVSTVQEYARIGLPEGDKGGEEVEVEGEGGGGQGAVIATEKGSPYLEPVRFHSVSIQGEVKQPPSEYDHLSSPSKTTSAPSGHPVQNGEPALPSGAEGTLVPPTQSQRAELALPPTTAQGDPSLQSVAPVLQDGRGQTSLPQEDTEPVLF